MDVLAHGLWGGAVFSARDKKEFWTSFLVGMGTLAHGPVGSANRLRHSRPRDGLFPDAFSLAAADAVCRWLFLGDT